MKFFSPLFVSSNTINTTVMEYVTKVLLMLKGRKLTDLSTHDGRALRDLMHMLPQCISQLSMFLHRGPPGLVSRVTAAAHQQVRVAANAAQQVRVAAAAAQQEAIHLLPASICIEVRWVP